MSREVRRAGLPYSAFTTGGGLRIMQLGIVGLGRMGLGIATRLNRRGHEVRGYDRDPERRREATGQGIACSETLSELTKNLAVPRVVWLMLPAGQSTNETIESLSELLESGDILIDGGNSFYRDTVRHAERLKNQGIQLLDAGVSGGVRGQHDGYCVMVGGEKEAYEKVQPAFRDLAMKGGCAYVGRSGAGHFAKMVHNAIEYTFLQGLGEGFELLRNSGYEYDLASLADLWNHGSVIRSWLLELAEEVFRSSPDLEDVRGWVADSGEARWALQEALERGVPVPTTAMSLIMRLRSRQEDSFSAKLVAKLREAFGGHEVKSSRDDRRMP
ncbi:MAG: decarboxylating 6-phosphogluconate dehydrogenase [Armatimonadota bacterium]|nr:decarboxylating 6-phosphogluconate dehydrogenase [Armatimonadota bacterium]